MKTQIEKAKQLIQNVRDQYNPNLHGEQHQAAISMIATKMQEVLNLFEFQYCMPDNVKTKEEHEQYLKDIGHEKYIKDLQHYKDSTVGLWVTDKPIIDLLNLFWQRSSDACPLECGEAEKQEKEFKEWAESISWQLK